MSDGDLIRWLVWSARHDPTQRTIVQETVKRWKGQQGVREMNEFISSDSWINIPEETKTDVTVQN